MKVYVVKNWEAYEGSVILQIFSEKQKAIDFARETGLKALDKTHREEIRFETVYEIRDEYSGFDVTEYEVN